MKYILLIYLVCLFTSSLVKGQTQLEFTEPIKQRVIVLTDITNEPDDQQSLVRFLVYANEYDIEGIIATTSTHLRNKVRKDKIEELVKNYGKVKANLDKNASGFPTAEYLHSVISEHLPYYSMEGVGEGKDSPGSELLISAVDKNNDRPLWISVWGGANCLAQALWKVQNTRTKDEVEKFVSKIKIYAISDQDFSGQWIRNTFPGIFYIVDASAGDSWLEYYKATWTGISGDKYYKNGPMIDFELVDNPWLKENIIENHGPLGANYIEFEYIMEGDTPSFLGLINNGLGWYHSPAYGGWGGRYDLYRSYAEKDKIWTSSVNTQDEVSFEGKTEASNQATIWRWRKAFQHDFAARMDWNIHGNFKNANHNPILVVNGNKGKALAKGKVKAGEQVKLSAKGSNDPEGNSLTYRWYLYKEAGKFNGKIEFKDKEGDSLQFTMPVIPPGQELHIILEAEDTGKPSLFSYRRIILTHP